MKQAIIGTDLSAASDRIMDNALAIKTFGIQKITLVYVLNLRSTDDFAEYNIESAQEKLDSQIAELQKAGFEADSKMVMGLPAMELMKQARILNASLVIIGSRGQSWSKPTLGETASEVLHNIKVPVLLMAFNTIRDEQEIQESMQENLHHYEKFLRQFRRQEPRIELMHKSFNKHVLFTTDFSDFSENAFQYLKSQVSPIPRLTLMHVQDIEKISRHLEHRLTEFNQIDTARLERLSKEFRQSHPETEIQLVLEYGNPKILIPKFITEHTVSLAVMGSQGRGYLSEFFLGSVSLRVARLAPSNLLIIPFNNKL